MAYWKKNNVVAGGEGYVFISVEGKKVELAGAKEVDATLTYEKSDVKALGHRMTGHKVTGASGEGSLTLYYITSEFRKRAKEYIKTGKAFTFDLYITNEDVASDLGRQTVVLYDCLFDEVSLALLNADNEILEEELSFTFDDFDIPEEFGGGYNQF